MDETTFLILGANGQLGRALQKQFPTAQVADSKTLDITDQASLARYDWSRVTVIFNAAAYTNVDGAESTDGRRTAWAVNAVGPAYLTEIANEHNITLFHISTDYVFDGVEQIHSEQEGFSPLSSYGASKAAGDIAVSLADKHYILRTAWVIGEGNNFVRTMMNLASKDISPTVVHDQIGRLTFTSELVRAIVHLLKSGAQFGTYNITNSGDTTSWADITRHIFAELKRDDLAITNTTTADYFADKEGMAPRPLESTFDLSKLEATGFTFTNWKDDLTRYMQEQQS
jgi:dTDP-4-dehydrorhamnose 3,5-epimerase/reductase